MPRTLTFGPMFLHGQEGSQQGAQARDPKRQGSKPHALSYGQSCSSVVAADVSVVPFGLAMPLASQRRCSFDSSNAIRSQTFLRFGLTRPARGGAGFLSKKSI